jgi:hypothetical protein
MYETRTMVPYLVLNPGVPRFLRDRLFTNVRTFDSKKLDIDVARGNRDIPVYVDKKESGNLVQHDGYVTLTYEAPYLHEYKFIGPSDLQFREPGENVYNYTPPAVQATERLNRDFLDLDTRYNRLEELQAVEILTTGKLVPRDRDGNAFPEINYQMRDTHRPVWNWSDSGVKKNAVIEMMEDANIDLLVRDGGKSVGLVVMGRNAGKSFMRIMDPDDETSGFNSVRVTRGEITPQSLPDGVSFLGRFAEIGNAPIYCYAEWYRDPWDHVTKPVFPEDMILMVGSGARMDRNYGFIENMNALRGIPRFPWVKIDPDGKGWEAHLESSPLLSIYEIDAVVAATVV